MAQQKLLTLGRAPQQEEQREVKRSEGHERSGEESRKWCGKVWRARRPTLAAGEEATFFREKGGGSCRG